MSCKLYTVIMRGSSLFKTSGFWPRVRARVLRTPVILSHATPNGALRAPPPPPIAASLLLFIPQSFPLIRTVRQGSISFHWAKLYPTELHCILLSKAAPS